MFMQAAPNYRDIHQPAPQPNKYQQALNAQLAKAKAIGMQRQQAQQAQVQAATKQANPQPQAADPKQLLDNGLRTGTLSYNG